MTDLAALGLSVRSDGVVVATDKLDDFKRASDDAARGADTLGGRSEKLGGMLRKLAVVAGGIAGTLAGMFSVRAVLSAAETYETRMLRLQAVIDATGGIAGRTTDQLEAQAQALARATLESVDGVMQAQQTLLTFRNVQGDIFDRTIEAAADMSAALGTGLQGSILQLAKALENPTQGLSALTRSGTVFTEQQKEMVAAMVEAGDLAKAQAFILSELEAQYGGASRAASGLSAAKDSLGQSLTNALIKFNEVTGLSDIMASAIARVDGWVQALTDNMDEIAAGAMDAFAGSARALGVVLIAMAATQIPALSAALVAAASGFSVATAGANALTAAMGILRGAVALAGGPWGILAAAIAAGVGYMVLFRDETEKTKDPINQVESAVKELNAAMGGFIGSSSVSQGESIKNAEGHRIQARAALEAARAEIVLMRAEQERFRNAPIEERGLLGDVEDKALQRNIDAATSQLDALTAQVEEADRRLKAAVGAITGGTAAGGRIVVPPAIPEVEFPEINIPGGAGGGGGRAKAAVDDLSESLKEAKAQTFDLNSSLAQTFTDALTGAKNLQDGIKDLLKSMANLFLNEAFTRVLTGLFPGFSAIPVGGIPGRERGGPVQAGRPYIVGERRPELFVPGQSGRIIPHVPAMSSGGGTSVQIINNTGEPVREQRQTGPDGREVVRVVVGEEIAKGGFDRQMGRFGVSPAKVRR